MKMKMKRTLELVLCTTMLLLCMVGCGKQSNETQNQASDSQSSSNVDGGEVYPNKTITIVVPWNAGGRGDTFARTVSNYLSKELGVSVIVSNQPGGVGVTGSYAVAESDPDGYTLGSFATTHMFASYLKNPPFKPEDFVPVGGYAEIYEALVVKADKPWNNLEDFFTDAKENPGKYIHGNTGMGQDDHIYAAALYAEQGVDVTQMPYDGDSGLTNALLAGEVDVAMIALPSVASYIDTGEMRVLAISSQDRLPDLPDVPTFAEQGIDFTETAWTALFAPKDTPDYVIEKLEEALDAVRNDPEYQETLKNMHVDVNTLDSDGMKKEIDRLLPKIQSWLDTLESLGANLGI